MNQIIIPISPDPLNGVLRKLHFTGLQIKSDLNMLLSAEVVYYAPDGTTPMLNAIEADEALTMHQKRLQIDKFRSVLVRADTSGVWVNEQGEPVELLAELIPPPNAMPEITFWQNIPLSVFLAGAGLPEPIMQVMAQIKFADLFYGAIQQGMQNMDSRKRF